ncbi:MAG: response regulator transcription factor [Myxococcota bacterium]|nr:response regulator transcription factor [Myxococcota bacterium]
MSTVLLVEDEPKARAHLASAIEARDELDLVGSETTLEGGRTRLHELRPDVLLTDLGLPDGSGLELVKEASELEGTHPLVVTVFGDDRHVLEAIRAGALGYLLKSESRAGVAEAILEVVEGGSPLSPSIARRILGELRGPATPEPTPEVPLSDRELEVLRHIVKGFTYAEIARLLEVSPTTVATHVRRVYRKLSVHSRSEATYEALQLGIIRPDE